MSGYARFAQFYDRLTENIDYAARAQYFDALITRHGGARGILLDLACGTGNLTTKLSELGYDTIGVDASTDMLSAAVAKPHEGIVYLCQDMRELDLYGTVDVTVCALDGINHLLTEEDLHAAFSSVSLFTNPGGLFLFDANTPYKHEHILGDNTFVYDMDDIYCVWQNEYDSQDCSVSIMLDIFERTEDETCFFKYEDSFSERAYTAQQLDSALESAGFTVLACYGADTFAPPLMTDERIVYVARKN